MKILKNSTDTFGDLGTGEDVSNCVAFLFKKDLLVYKWWNYTC